MNTSFIKINRKFLLGSASAIVIAAASIPASAQEGDQQDDAETSGIETIVVTATKRAQNVQDIPASVQAISGAAIEEMGAHNSEDYMRFIPAVSFVSTTPGSNDIVFRGINIGLGSYIGQAAASMYLDETSLTSSGSQPDVRMVDIAGVEALSGPQGTLYGDSAQAGILRITTHKPVMNEYQAIIESGLRKGAHSDLSWDVSGVINLPLLEDKLAIRIVAERARDGGFIDNVLGNTPDGHAYYWYDQVIAYQFPDWGTADNAHVVEDRWNGVDYLTARFSAKLNLNEDWSATFSMAHQQNEINGGDGGYNPFVGDLKTVNFNKYFREDKWDMYGLVLEGDLGWAQLVSSTSFFKRNIDNRYDDTVYGKYYSVLGCYSADGATASAARYCTGPELGSDVLSFSSYPEQQQKFAQEIRMSGQAGNFDWLVGAYLEDSSVRWDGDFNGPSNFNYQDSLSLAYFEDELYPGEKFPNAVAPWGDSNDTSWKQYAVFGETTWHMSDKIHLTVGARWFQRENSSFFKAFQPDKKLNPDFVSGLPSTAKVGKDRQFVPKISLSYDINEDSMVYGLYTIGYRPGGTNRSRGDINRLVFPTVYNADKLTNYEIGSRNRFFDNKVQLNFTYYYMKWDDYQLQVVDPSFQGCTAEETVFCDQPWQSVVANSPGGAHTEGVEIDAIIQPTEGLKMGGNVNWLSAKTDGPFEEANIAGGMSLPNVPKWKGSIYASYFWPVEFVSGGEMFIRGQYTYQSEANNRLVNGGGELPTGSGLWANPRLVNEAYGIADISAGLLAHDAGWEVSFYINNIADKRAQYQHSTGQFDYQFSNTGAVSGGTPYSNYSTVYTNRPREFGMRIKWSYQLLSN